MKIRTIYFKADNIEKAVKFWMSLLSIEPHKTFPTWHEFMCGNVRLGLLLNDFGDKDEPTPLGVKTTSSMQNAISQYLKDG